MTSNKIAQLINGGLCMVDFFAKARENLAGFVIEKMDQDVIFIFKVEVNCSISNSSRPCNLRYGRFMETGFCKYGDRRFQDAMIFIIFSFGTNGVSPSAGSPNPYMNEYSFIYQRRSRPVKLKSIPAKNALEPSYYIDHHRPSEFNQIYFLVQRCKNTR